MDDQQGEVSPNDPQMKLLHNLLNSIHTRTHTRHLSLRLQNTHPYEQGAPLNSG